MLPGQRVRQTRWRPFERVFTDGSSERRFLRETVYGTRRAIRYYQITTDPIHLPPETTWDLMTNLPGQIQQTVGNTFGLRTWIEYGFKHAKDDLGWADYRVTDYASIERWWELVMSAYTLVSLQSPDLAALGQVARAPTRHPRGAGRPRRAGDPSGLGYRSGVEAPPQHAPAPVAALRLCLPAPALAPPGAVSPRPGGPDWPRRAGLTRQHLPLGSPNMTEEGDTA